MKNVSAALAFTLAAAGFAATASAQVTWKAISFIPKNHPVMWGANAWVNDVNAALKAELQINYVGGPEVVPRYQQTEAVRNKVVDVVFAAAADYPDQIPAAATFPLSKLSPMEERKSGYFDYLVEAHKKLNAQYLGRVHTGAFYLWVDITRSGRDSLLCCAVRHVRSELAVGSCDDRDPRAGHQGQPPLEHRALVRAVGRRRLGRVLRQSARAAEQRPQLFVGGSHRSHASDHMGGLGSLADDGGQQHIPSQQDRSRQFRRLHRLVGQRAA